MAMNIPMTLYMWNTNKCEYLKLEYQIMKKLFDITRFLSRNSHDNIVWMQKSNKEFQLKIGICRIRISQ